MYRRPVLIVLTLAATFGTASPPDGGGACIIGLNCGCIRNITCPAPHRRPAPDNGKPHSARPGPGG